MLAGAVTRELLVTLEESGDGVRAVVETSDAGLTERTLPGATSLERIGITADGMSSGATLVVNLRRLIGIDAAGIDAQGGGDH